MAYCGEDNLINTYFEDFVVRLLGWGYGALEFLGLHDFKDLKEDLRNTQFRRQERRHGAMSYANGLRMMQGMMSERWPADVEDTLRAHGIPLLQRQARNWVDVGNGQVFPVETVRPWSEDSPARLADSPHTPH